MITPTITIEITSEGWETKIKIGVKEFSEKFQLTRSGSESIGDTLESIEELEPYENVINELQTFFMLDVATALKNT